ncbi:hypothetical protein Tco_0204913 [Tanacetum coccineum]
MHTANLFQIPPHVISYRRSSTFKWFITSELYTVPMRTFKNVCVMNSNHGTNPILPENEKVGVLEEISSEPREVVDVQLKSSNNPLVKWWKKNETHDKERKMEDSLMLWWFKRTCLRAEDELVKAFLRSARGLITTVLFLDFYCGDRFAHLGLVL